MLCRNIKVKIIKLLYNVYILPRFHLCILKTKHPLQMKMKNIEMKLLYSSFVYFHGNKNVHYIST